ncbi:GNAT family N-acetyltransferase [Streptomyces pactum]|uniref:GNAT family N-acetyltransferase n=1 Tax=Streptomyces pactum TaxID=68249 RepID=A0A1S6J239_9ACTN|nr:GNAT family N-acetyltransferase [Streptomyces pactum]AQS65822.1 GNAT family N-acetyltransferase [Streptomyces pactum]
MVGEVVLRQVDEVSLEGLLTVAVEDAEPEEVMPPVAGPPGWTPLRREAFRAWHRARRPGLAGPLRESTFVIHHEGRIVGSARLAVRGSLEVLETGMWLARSRRGRGIGGAALRVLLGEAAEAGARTVVADTKTHNAAALAALRGIGATLVPSGETDDVHAELRSRTMPSPRPAAEHP